MKRITRTLTLLATPEVIPTWFLHLIDLAVLLWIGWFAWKYAGFLLRNDLYLYGDHPGQFQRLWQLLAVVWPEEGRLIGLTPYWQAGRPELQFYPPGFAFLGWLIWMASFQQLPLFVVYQTLVFISYILPAVGFYLLMAWGLGDRLAGMMAAWLVMTFPFPLGGVQGVIIGIVGYQLAYGLTPLLILAGVWGMQADRKAWPWLVTGVLMAATMLLHPFQVFFPTGVLGLYALFKGKEWLARLRWLGGVILLALGLITFWWLPLSIQTQNFIPLVEASLLGIRNHFENMWFAGMGWLLAVALLGSFLQRGNRRSLALAILVGGAGFFAFILFNYLVIMERFNIFALDSVRLIPGVTFAILAGLALGVSELAWLGTRVLHRWSWGAAGLPLLVIVPWLIINLVNDEYDFSKWITKYQPAPHRTPFFLREAEARYHLPDAWQVMANTSGRVLFTSAYALLYDVPTSLKALTPFLTGREIIGGVFTLRSPAASYLWVGQRNPGVLRGKVEMEDDRSLAGVPWAAMTDDFLLDLVRHFNITLIATIATDVHAQAFLDNSAHFKPVWSNKLFTFYEIADYEPAWIEAEGATATTSLYSRTVIDVNVTEAQAGATLLVKVGAFPRWRAEIQGESVPIQMEEHGLIEITLPPGSYTIHLRYGPAWPERLGAMISWATTLGAMGVVLATYWHRWKVTNR